MFEHLDQLGIATTTLDHPPVFTVAESEAIDRAVPGGHTKNLFLKDAKGRLFLVVAWTGTVVDLKGLPARIGSARLSFGNAELMGRHLGVSPGSVTAFAAINDRDSLVTVVLDKALLAFATINCHPLENTATTSIGRDDLLAFLRSTGHEPLIIDLAVS
ncbi:MAG: prolyl-tRNA synthetase associated domain-containing protein [Hyphomicrobiaceae bacterium]|nr:prolyl-tRNA synthetase associated domain-containing protein [Hyphomicrobiaceae bacterium]